MERHVRSLLFRSRRSKLLAAGASFAAIAVLVLVLPASVASGDTSVSTSTLVDGGVLRLALGTTDRLTFHEPDGTGGYETSAAGTQSITNSSGCRLAPGGDLVTFSPVPSNNSVGFVSDAIGVRGSSEGNGQPCGRIDAPNQQLILDLGGGLAGKVIDYAEIDLELKFGATALVTGFLDGTPVGAAEDYSSTGSDSGPDSADGDNYRIRFPQTGTTTVDRLVISISSPTGGASLEGGADGTPPCDVEDSADCAGDGSLGGPLNLNTTDTLFHLLEVDGVLDCGDTAPTQGGGGTPANSLERLDNVGGAACTAIPFNLDSSTDIEDCGENFLQCVLLQKDLLGQNAQFFWTVTWAPEPGDYQESETQFDFGNGPQDLQLCEADAGGDGFPDLPPTADTEDPPGAVDPWCVVETSTVLQFDPVGGETFVVVTEKYFGSGDPLGKRG